MSKNTGEHGGLFHKLAEANHTREGFEKLFEGLTELFGQDLDPIIGWIQQNLPQSLVHTATVGATFALNPAIAIGLLYLASFYTNRKKKHQETTDEQLKIAAISQEIRKAITEANKHPEQTTLNIYLKELASTLFNLTSELSANRSNTDLIWSQLMIVQNESSDKLDRILEALLKNPATSFQDAWFNIDPTLTLLVPEINDKLDDVLQQLQRISEQIGTNVIPPNPHQVPIKDSLNKQLRTQNQQEIINAYPYCFGRDEETHLIISWLVSSKKGRRLLVSPPGVGKSALMAHLLRTLESDKRFEVIAYFLKNGEPDNSEEVFKRTIPREIVTSSPGSLKRIILIDGLDEALFTFPDLGDEADGVFIIASMRRDDRTEKGTLQIPIVFSACPRLQIQHLKSDAIGAWILEMSSIYPIPESTTSTLVRLIQRKTKGYPLYIHYILEEINDLASTASNEEQRLERINESIDSLPKGTGTKGFEQYVARCWRQLEDHQVLGRELLLLTAAAQQDLSFGGNAYNDQKPNDHWTEVESIMRLDNPNWILPSPIPKQLRRWLRESSSNQDSQVGIRRIGFAYDLLRNLFRSVPEFEKQCKSLERQIIQFGLQNLTWDYAPKYLPEHILNFSPQQWRLKALWLNFEFMALRFACIDFASFLNFNIRIANEMDGEVYQNVKTSCLCLSSALGIAKEEPNPIESFACVIASYDHDSVWSSQAIKFTEGLRSNPLINRAKADLKLPELQTVTKSRNRVRALSIVDQKLTIGLFNGMILSWDPHSNNLQAIRDSDGDSILDFAIDEDKDLLFFSTQNGNVGIIHSDNQISILQPIIGVSCNSLSFSIKEKALYMGYDDGSLHRYIPSTGYTEQSVNAGLCGINSLTHDTKGTLYSGHKCGSVYAHQKSECHLVFNNSTGPDEVLALLWDDSNKTLYSAHFSGKILCHTYNDYAYHSTDLNSSLPIAEAYSLCLSPKTGSIISGHRFGYVMEHKDGRSRILTSESMPAAVWSLAISNNSETLYIGNRAGKVLSYDSLQDLLSADDQYVTPRYYASAYDPRSRKAYCGTVDGLIITNHRSIQLPSSHKSAVYSITVGRYSGDLFFGRRDGSAWRRTKDSVELIASQSEAVWSICEADTLDVFLGLESGTILWQRGSQTAVLTVPPEVGSAYALAWDPNSRILYSGHRWGHILRHSVGDSPDMIFKRLPDLPGYFPSGDAIWALDFDPDSHKLYVSQFSGLMQIFSVGWSGSRLVETVILNGPVRSIHAVNDQEVFTCDHDNQVLHWKRKIEE